MFLLFYYSVLSSCNKKFNLAKLYLLNTNCASTVCQNLMCETIFHSQTKQPICDQKEEKWEPPPSLESPWPPLILDDSSFLQHVSIILTSGLFIFHLVSSATFSTVWIENLTSYVCVIKGSQEYWIS